MEDDNGEISSLQQNLKGYATGSDATIRSYRALNDVATALFIQGKALENAQRHNEAKESYKELVTKYSYGQCWDPHGWFWKPAVEANNWLNVLDKKEYICHRSEDCQN